MLEILIVVHDALRSGGLDVGGDYRKLTGGVIRCLGGGIEVLWRGGWSAANSA
jgi:hypothetical protein